MGLYLPYFSDLRSAILFYRKGQPSYTEEHAKNYVKHSNGTRSSSLKISLLERKGATRHSRSSAIGRR